MSDLNIHRKILKVISSLHGVEQKGYNNYQKYNYTRQEDVINAIRPLLVENGLVILPEVIQEESIIVEGRGVILSKVTVEFKVIDIDSGDSIVIKSKGYGIDSGDKAIYKAITGAEKYFYMKTFLIGTPNDDAEADEQIEEVLNKSISNNNNFKSRNTYNPQNNVKRVTPIDNSKRVTPNDNSKKVNPTDNSQRINPINLNKDEKTIDKKLQDFLFVASRQNQDIVIKAINKFGYRSPNDIRVSDYKKILEVIKQSVKKLTGSF